MARTLLVRMANGVGTPTAELILRGQFLVTETVTLVEHATAKRTYTGTVTAAAGTYDINLKSGAAYIGGDVVVLSGVDGTTSRAQGIDGDLSGTTVGDVTAALANKLADIIIRRTMASVESSADGEALALSSLYGFIQQAQESSRSGTTLTIKKTDGSTTLGTKTLAVDASASPITGVS